MRKAHYHFNVVLRPEPEGGFTALVPALPGCVTYGRTLAEAREMAKDAVSGSGDWSTTSRTVVVVAPPSAPAAATIPTVTAAPAALAPTRVAPWNANRRTPGMLPSADGSLD